MKNITTNFLIACGIILFSVACGDKKETESQGTNTETKPAETTMAENKKEELPGKGVYATYCSVCHQPDGKGVANMNPPLANKEWVGGDKTKIIKVVLNGLNGKITVDGVPYESVMTSHDFLTDKQISDVLTYVRQSFGNDYEAITEAEVTQTRANNKK